MNKLKELWGYAVFRWCVYQTPGVVFGILASSGVFSRYSDSWGFGREDLQDYATLIWILILVPSAVWVWRKPIWIFIKGPVWNQIKRVVGYLNKKAEEG